MTECATLHPAKLCPNHHFVGDYSFDPLDLTEGEDGAAPPPRAGYRDDPVVDVALDDEEVPPPSSLFPAPGATAAAAAAQKASYTEKLRHMPRQHVFAPPGKIGIAIDVINGQPVRARHLSASVAERRSHRARSPSLSLSPPPTSLFFRQCPGGAQDTAEFAAREPAAAQRHHPGD